MEGRLPKILSALALGVLIPKGDESSCLRARYCRFGLAALVGIVSGWYQGFASQELGAELRCGLRKDHSGHASNHLDWQIVRISNDLAAERRVCSNRKTGTRRSNRVRFGTVYPTRGSSGLNMPPVVSRTEFRALDPNDENLTDRRSEVESRSGQDRERHANAVPKMFSLTSGVRCARSIAKIC